MRWKWLRNGLFVFSILIIAGYLARDFLFFTFLYRGTPADWELSRIRNRHQELHAKFDGARRGVTVRGSVDPAQEEFLKADADLREQCLKIAEANPQTRAELGALYFVAGTWSTTDAGRRALEQFEAKVATADLDHLGSVFETIPLAGKEALRPLVPALVQRAEQDAEHPRAATLLTKAACLLAPESDVPAASPEFVEIADLIVAKHASSPAIYNFCNLFGHGDWSPAWAQPFESHLRRILEVNRDRFVRCNAKLSLASVVQDSPDNRQDEAEQLFEEFLSEFDGRVNYHARGIEEMARNIVRRQLELLRSHGVGKPAPETNGIDLEGNPLYLADYRGRVVLVSFWATWCAPCMRMIPHEKALLEQFPADQFAIVGVNSDTTLDLAKNAVARHAIPWRSFRNAVEGQREIADAWGISGYPTFYLLDKEGRVCRRWIGDQPEGELARTITQLLAGTPPERHSPPTGASEAAGHYSAISVVADAPGARGFVERRLRSSTGHESRYVVFIPRRHDKTPLPVILFLHGSGSVGSDGRGQLTGALANAIQKRGEDFPFLVVFPQSLEGSWMADSPDGQRAMAILDEVLSKEPADPTRVYLTGLSMGGEGTWSLAAEWPERWAAIVPLCGGGDPHLASRISRIPCWCFHGEADRMISPILTQRMVQAIRKAGGQPLYHQYPGVDHNCWDRTYARDDLYEWLLNQKRRLQRDGEPDLRKERGE